ncbi:MAG: tRNA pseudouridine(55) synthase TruB [Armatimonadota bacterium]
MDGVLNIDKPPGPTSHDVVDQVRKIFGQRRVGHAGTLDPLASGVLVVCLGKGTRIVQYIMSSWKEYHAGVVLGAETDTGDITGRVLVERDASSITRKDFEEVADEFVGDIQQVPPMFSAVKHEGRRLYELAREGRTVQPSPRKVTIYSIYVVGFDDTCCAGFGSNKRYAEIVVRCSSGTYVRTLCVDIGRKLGCGAYVSMLRRTAVGKFRIDDAVKLGELEVARHENRLNELVYSLDHALALAELPAVRVESDEVARVSTGLAVSCEFEGQAGCVVRILGPDNSLLAVGRVISSNGGMLVHPEKVLTFRNG